MTVHLNSATYNLKYLYEALPYRVQYTKENKR